MISETGRAALRQEAAAILACADRLGQGFERAVELILECAGRVIPCGIGKSGHIARKTAGTLGRRLLLRVADVMRKGDDLATVHTETSFMETLRSITSAGAGAACVVDEGRMVGIITDGDLRRHMRPDLLEQKVETVMTPKPITVRADQLASEVLEIMNSSKITALFVVEGQKTVGIVHLHDLLRAGVA